MCTEWFCDALFKVQVLARCLPGVISAFLHVLTCYVLQKHLWKFCPLEKRSYAFRVSIHGVHNTCSSKYDHPVVKKFKAILSVLGEGSFGTIKV